jgi:hypothetical protein
MVETIKDVEIMENENEIYNKIFRYACKHFSTAIHTLTGIEKLNQPTLGLEGWFRVELIKALEKTEIVNKISNKGADLLLENGDYLELKAGADLNFSYILDGVKTQNCIFLGKPRFKKIIYNKEKIVSEFISRDPTLNINLQPLEDNWFIGLIYKN